MAERSKGMAGLLAFLLGVFGAHRFYVNREKQAMLYFVPTGLLAIALVYTGIEADAVWTSGQGMDVWEDAWSMAFLGLMGAVLAIMLVGWAEAIRFWTMPDLKFERLYVAPVVASQEAAPHPREHVTTSKSKGTAALLGVFLGAFGVHRYYIGRPLGGTLVLLLSLAGMAGVAAGIALGGRPELTASGAALLGLMSLFGFLDGLRLAMMRRRTFEFRYGRTVEDDWGA